VSADGVAAVVVLAQAQKFGRSGWRVRTGVVAAVRLLRARWVRSETVDKTLPLTRERWAILLGLWSPLRFWGDRSCL
jgi:hypothetical protein